MITPPGPDAPGFRAGARFQRYAVPVSLLPNDPVALLVAASFAAGINLYATIATLGLLEHFSFVSLPTSLHLLDSRWIIGPARSCSRLSSSRIKFLHLI